MASPVVIRPALSTDAAALGRMGAGLVRLHHSLDSRRFLVPDANVESGYRWWLSRELGREGSVVLVAERAGEVLGYAYGTAETRDWNALRDAHGEFHDLWVEDRARGAGVGQLLAEALVRRLRELGVPRVMLMTAVDNEPARRLFARLGWRPTMLEMTREVEEPPAEG